MRHCCSRNHSECIPPLSQMEQLRGNYFFKLGKLLSQLSEMPNSCLSCILEQVLLFQSAPSWFCCNNRAQQLPPLHHCSLLQLFHAQSKTLGQTSCISFQLTNPDPKERGETFLLAQPWSWSQLNPKLR